MKKVLITGVGSGIGRATAEKFLSEGDLVIGQYNRNIDGVNALKTTYGDKFFAYKANFQIEEEINSMLDDIEKDFKHIDVLVNNAGMGLYKLKFHPFEAIVYFLPKNSFRVFAYRLQTEQINTVDLKTRTETHYY